MDYRTEIPNVIQTIADGSGPTTAMVGGREITFPGGNANGIFEKSDLGAPVDPATIWLNQETTIDQAQVET